MGVSGNPAKQAAADRARAEARAALEAASTEPITLTLHGKSGEAEIEVPDFLDWEDSAAGLMERGLIREWAQSVLDDDNYAKWCQVRPTNRTAGQFVDAWSEASGEDPGELPAS